MAARGGIFRRIFRYGFGAFAVFLATLAYCWLTTPDVRPLKTQTPTTTAFMRMRQAQAALCLSEREDNDADPELVPTADFGYLRLRKPSYSEADLVSWVERVRAQPWREVFVFFKHEDEGIAPRLALRFRELFAAPEREAPTSA